MPIIATAILPNHPLLLPGLSTEIKRQVVKTRHAFEYVATDYKTSLPELIVIIAEQDSTIPLKINHHLGFLVQSPALSYNFPEYGDLATTGSLKFSTSFTHRLKESSETILRLPQVTLPKAPLSLVVPLVNLGVTYDQIPVVGLLVAPDLQLDAMNQISEWLENFLTPAHEKILLIGSGTLFQTKKDNASARILAKQFQKCITENNLTGLANINQTKKNLHNTLSTPAILLYQVLKNSKISTEVISFENVSGAGLLLAQIKVV